MVLDKGKRIFLKKVMAEAPSIIVDVVEPLGNETHLHIDMGGVKAIARCDGRKIIHPEEKVAIALNLKHLHLFDANSTESIY